MLCISAVYAVKRCPSVCLSVTKRNEKNIFKIFSPSGYGADVGLELATGSLFFRLCFLSVGFSYVVLDLVCSAILPSDWLVELCPNDAYVEELVSTKTSCFRTR